MRALAYFTVDSDAESGPFSRVDLSHAFEVFCESRRHIPQGIYDDPRDREVRAGWRAMVDFIRDSQLGYLVVVPGAEHLGATIEQQVERVLEMDALSSEVICDDPEIPDPLQNALRGSGRAAQRRERIREGMKAKAAKGLGLGKPPYGYRIHAEGGFHLVAHEADVVKEIFRRYIDTDGGVRTIATYLNDQGLRTRTGRQWSMVTVRDILRNTAYIGTYRRFGLRIPGSYEPIITPADFRVVQDRMHERSPVRRNPVSLPFLLSGFVYCGYCEQRMMGVTRRQAWRRRDGERAQAEYRYYQCQSRINRNQCDYRTTRADELEDQVIRSVREQLVAAPTADSVDYTAWMADDRSRSIARIRALDRRFLEGVQRTASGGLTLGQLRGALSQLQAAKDALNDRIRRTSEAASARALVAASADRVLNGWGDLSEPQRRELLRSLVVQVTVKDGYAQAILR